MPVIDQYIKQLIITEKNRNTEHYWINGESKHEHLCL